MKQVKKEVQSKKTPTSFPMKKPRIRNIECNDPVVISAIKKSSKKKVAVYLLRMMLHSCFVVNNDQVTIMLSEEDRSKVDTETYSLWHRTSDSSDNREKEMATLTDLCEEDKSPANSFN